MNVLRKQTEVVVVGSGPGGATVARELARAGVSVALLERGKDHRQAPYYGTYLGALLYADRHALFFTTEGLQIVRPLTVGGATSMYCGSAAMPPAWLRDRHGLDLEPYARSAAAELRVAPLPPELRGEASTRLAETAATIGQDWQPQPKLMDPGRVPRLDCGARCMLGCRCRAKWSAAEWVDEAVAAGAQLYADARVDGLLRTEGAVAGVRAVWRGRTALEVEAPVVVLAAGGLGTPEVLRRAGFDDLAPGMAMDTTVIVYGRSRYPGLGHEPPMTWSYADSERGYMLSTLIDPWLLYPLITGLGSNHALATVLYGRLHGLAVAAVLVPQPVDDRVRETLAAIRRQGARVLEVPDRRRAVVAAARVWLAALARDGRPPYVVPPGGSSPVGTLGYVGAALELADQIASGALPAPEGIFVAGGSPDCPAGSSS